MARETSSGSVFQVDYERKIVCLRFDQDYPRTDAEMDSFLQAFYERLYRQGRWCLHVYLDSVPGEFARRYTGKLQAFIKKHREESKVRIAYTLFETQKTWVRLLMQLVFNLAPPASPYIFTSMPAQTEAYYQAHKP